MDEKPIDSSELDQLVQQMRTKRNALTGWTAIVTGLGLNDLAEHHEDWLMLYQLGQEIMSGRCTYASLCRPDIPLTL